MTYALAVLRGIKPDPKLVLSDWADEHFYLSPESAATAGKWYCIPYQREILDVVSYPEVEYITVMKSARVGYTKCINIIVASSMAETPSNVMVVQPTLTDAEGYSTSEIMPMLRDVPKLNGLVADSKNRDNSNTMLRKVFRGGQLLIVGANSASGFRRVSIKVLIFDEVDGYPISAGAEGDQIKLGVKRTEYYHDRKIIMGSTPTLRGYSRIEKSFEQSDKRRYYVPCPECGTMQYLKWSQIQWPKGEPEKAEYRCENQDCDVLIPHSKKRSMVEAGKWIATAPFKGHAGFHIWAAYSYSPNATWGHIAKEFLEAKEGGVETLQTWVNTTLGETWEDEANEGLESEIIAQRREMYDASKVLPKGVLVITAGVDVQDDYFAIEILGVGYGEETWSLDYLTITGEASNEKIRRQLDNVLRRIYQTHDGVDMGISAVCVDTAGHHTDSVYDFVRDKTNRRIYGIVGRANKGKPLVSIPNRRNKGKVPLLTLNTIAGKDLLFSRLKLAESGHGYCHFPMSYDDEYFAMLVAEKVVTRYVKGVPKREYVQTRKRNEALDCRIYAMAAYRLLNARLDKVDANLKKKIGSAVDVKKIPGKKKTTTNKVTRRPTQRRPRKGGFVNSWKE